MLPSLTPKTVSPSSNQKVLQRFDNSTLLASERAIFGNHDEIRKLLRRGNYR